MPEESIWTSASATARFLETQRPNGTAFVVGESGLSTSLYQSGYTSRRSADRPLAGRPAADHRVGRHVHRLSRPSFAPA